LAQGRFTYSAEAAGVIWSVDVWEALEDRFQAWRKNSARSEVVESSNSVVLGIIGTGCCTGGAIGCACAWGMVGFANGGQGRSIGSRWSVMAAGRLVLS
jgi:hypothetical protein